MPKRRIVLVDDHPLVRSGLRRIADPAPRRQVVAEATDAYEALPQVDIHRPALVLVDVQLPGVTGLRIASLRYAVSKGWAEIGPQLYAPVERALGGDPAGQGAIEEEEGIAVGAVAEAITRSSTDGLISPPRRRPRRDRHRVEGRL